MWYPLKNSVYAISVVSVILATLLAVSRPNLPPSPTAVTDAAEAIKQATGTLATHLLIADKGQRVRAVAQLNSAADALVSALHAQAHAASSTNRIADTARSRRQASMPFFSFADVLPRKPEPGA